MDATAQVNTDVPLFWQFYLPSTGAPYAPTPAPTGLVYRLNQDGTRTVLAGTPTPLVLTAIVGLTGAYTYVLDDSLNTALGQLIGQATTTDAALTPYPEYATRNYDVQVLSESTDPLATVVPGSYVPGQAGYDISLLPGINTRVQGGTVTIIDGFNARATILTIKKYQTYSAATNPLQVTVSVPVDPTGVDIYLTLLQANVATRFTGTCVSYNSGTDEATLNFDMTSTQSGALEQYNGEFAVSIVDASNDVFQSIPYPSGQLVVKVAPLMPPAP